MLLHLFFKEEKPRSFIRRRNKHWGRGICYCFVFIKTIVPTKFCNKGLIRLTINRSFCCVN